MRRVTALAICGVLVSVGVLSGAAAPAAAATTVASTASLQAAFAAGGTVILGADIPGPVGGLAVTPGKPVVLDLAGHSLVAHGGTMAAGIEVGAGSSLTVEDTSKAGAGKLASTGDVRAAGIGGNEFEAGGSVAIMGGKVTATGGALAAGIGGGDLYGAGTITISGGTVTATGGGNAAGIGGGPGGTGGTITISGGSTTATAGVAGSGIGGGYGAAAGTISLLGGTITASADLGATFGDGPLYAGAPTPITVGGSQSSGPDQAYTGSTNAPSAFVGNGAAGVHFSATSNSTSPQTITFAEDVMFDSRGGSAVHTQTVDYGAAVTQPSVTRAGYQLSGWHVGTVSGPRYDFSSPVTRPIDLVASWTATSRNDPPTLAVTGIEIPWLGGVVALLAVTCGVLMLALRRRMSTR